MTIDFLQACVREGVIEGPDLTIAVDADGFGALLVGKVSISEMTERKQFRAQGDRSVFARLALIFNP